VAYEETSDEMPKNKTHSGSKKRFSVTGSGKVRHRQAGRNHLLEHKPSTLTRRLAGLEVLGPGDTRRVKKLLGR